MPSNVSILHKDDEHADEVDEHADEFPWDVSDSLCRIISLCKPIVAAAVRVAVSNDFEGEDAGCGGPGLVWLHVVCGCEAEVTLVTALPMERYLSLHYDYWERIQ